MANTTKKLLSLVIAVIMVLSMIPAVSASQEPEQAPATRGSALGASTTYAADKWIEVSTTEDLLAYLSASNEKSINIAENKATTVGIKLMDDMNITTNDVLWIGVYSDVAENAFPVNVVLDLNGHTITDTGVKSRMFATYTGSNLVITNGSIQANGSYYGTGGLVFINGNGALTFDGVDARVKVAKDSTAGSGGIAAMNNAPLTVKNSTLEVYTDANEATYTYQPGGGGMFYTGYTNTFTFENSEFIGGSASNGGQFRIAAGVTMNADNCSFSNASATAYGGVMHITSMFAEINLTDCDFENCSSVNGGGFISTTASPTINATDCTFTGGSAGKSGSGGCVYIYKSEDQNKTPRVNFTRCTVSNCSANGANGGAIFAKNTKGYPASISLVDCTISGCSAYNGGSLYVYSTGWIDAETGEIAQNALVVCQGGSMTTGSATNHGGNMYIDGAAIVALRNGFQCSNGTAGGRGGNFYSGSDSARITINMYDATFSGGTAGVRGGNVSVNFGTFNMYGGAITGGSGNNNGDLFYVHNFNSSFGTLNMYGGTLEHTTSTSAVAGTGNVNIYNGTVNGFDISAEAVADHSTAAQIPDTNNWVFTHANTDGEENDTVASCETNGAIIVVCDCCTQPYTYVTEEATGHDYESVVTAPTCTAAGYTTYTCSGCGDSYTADEVDAIDHDYKAVVTAPTCTAAGYTTYTCSGCGDSYTADEVAATDHAWGEGVIDPAPTCNAAGTKTYTCSGCGETKTEAVEATGHDYKAVVTAPTCTAAGYTTYTCSACGDSYTADEVAAIDHDYKAVVTAPTCEAAGYTTYTCSACGDSYTADEVDATGHAWGEGVIDPEPTCSAAGTETFTCSTCGETKTEAVEATGHAWDEGTYTDPTFEADGYTTYTCSACGETKTEVDEGTMLQEAAFTSNPENVTADVNTDAVFTVAAVGVDLTYCWQYSRDGIAWHDTKMDGWNTDTLSVPVLLTRDGYQYRCVITDAYGNSATSEVAELTVNEPVGLVKITSQPAARGVFAGENAVFTVAATGDGLKYQWQYTKNGSKWFDTAMTGATTAELSVIATAARDGYQYRCVITDAYGTQAISDAAALTVSVREITATGPEDQTAAAGTNATFTVVAQGESLTYRWQYQRPGITRWIDTAMAGCDTDALTVAATKARNGYSYRCIITDPYGNETVSDEAVLTVE